MPISRHRNPAQGLLEGTDEADAAARADEWIPGGRPRGSEGPDRRGRRRERYGQGSGGRALVGGALRAPGGGEATARGGRKTERPQQSRGHRLPGRRLEGPDRGDAGSARRGRRRQRPLRRWNHSADVRSPLGRPPDRALSCRCTPTRVSRTTTGRPLWTSPFREVRKRSRSCSSRKGRSGSGLRSSRLPSGTRGPTHEDADPGSPSIRWRGADGPETGHTTKRLRCPESVSWPPHRAARRCGRCAER